MFKYSIVPLVFGLSEHHSHSRVLEGTPSMSVHKDPLCLSLSTFYAHEYLARALKFSLAEIYVCASFLLSFSRSPSENLWWWSWI